MNKNYNRAWIEREVIHNDLRKYCEYEMPHPQCDESCRYHCTEGGKFTPKCEQKNLATLEINNE